MIGFEVLLEILVSVLLVGTIAYAAILNRKLNVLRQGREEFETLVRDMNRAIERAEQGTLQFRKLSETNAAQLDDAVKEAKVLRDDLGYLIDRGTALADRITVSTRTRKAEPTAVVETFHPKPVESPIPKPSHESAAEEVKGWLDDGLSDEVGELPPETQEKLKKLISSLR